MRLHRTGITPILVLLAGVLAIFLLINTLFPVQTIFHMVLYAIGAVFMFFVIRFFRFPDRSVVVDPDAVYSGADGKVVAIEKVHVDEYFNDERMQVSVFMSPVNVHINWSPIAGEVTYRKYHPGKFMVAFNPKSSLVNEHTSFVVKDNKNREVMMRQIAGALARRILLEPKEGARLEQGGVVGMIRFGSRVDLLLPVNARVEVNIGDVVKGTGTVIARLSE